MKDAQNPALNTQCSRLKTPGPIKPAVGDLVKPLKGRDAGKLMFIVGFDGERALLADGKSRPVERPKLKKPRHLIYAARPDGHVPGKLRDGEKVNNSELRKTIAALAVGFPAAEVE